MYCLMQFLDARIFDWSTTMINCMKRHITECWECNNKKFGFDTILFSFIYERVPSLSPRETLWGHVASFLAVCRWETLFPQQGGWRTIEAFDFKFFDWWARKIPTIEDYPYNGIKFSRDPNMPILLEEERGEIYTCVLSYLIFNFFYISFFICIRILTTMCLLCTDVGPIRPKDFSRTRWHPRPEAVPTIVGRPTGTGGPPTKEAERVLRWVERNLTNLTREVPMVEIEDLPPSMQPHVVGVPQTWVQLFHCLENDVFHYSRANRPRY